MDQKNADMYKTTNDLSGNLKGQVEIMKNGKSIDDSCVFQTPCLSAMPAYSQQP